MKKITATVILAAMLITAAGCSGSTSSVNSNTAESTDSITVESANAEFTNISSSFMRPAEVFNIDNESGKPSDSSVSLTFDENDRIHTCDYQTADGLQCRAIYTYEDTYAHIYTFGGDYLVDDVVIKCEYSEDSGWTVIDGYHFKNTSQTDV